MKTTPHSPRVLAIGDAFGTLITRLGRDCGIRLAVRVGITPRLVDGGAGSTDNGARGRPTGRHAGVGIYL